MVVVSVSECHSDILTTDSACHSGILIMVMVMAGVTRIMAMDIPITVMGIPITRIMDTITATDAVIMATVMGAIIIRVTSLHIMGHAGQLNRTGWHLHAIPLHQIHDA